MPIKDPVKRRENHARYMREIWYPANRKKHIKMVHAVRVRRRKEIRAFLAHLKPKCSRCAECDPVALDFHHCNPKEKETCLARVAIKQWSNKRILAEIDKCIVLCANCHRKLHRRHSGAVA